ncbi:MAG: multidrug effflux MFS transporter [Porphyromonadaceae bacterium]|nr:MAG: multidrug effflux MFS transporter [Porphyromonadaceae bacterium]
MNKKINRIFFPATLGMLTAFGPFLTDFYLPVLPEMAEFFHTSPTLASLSLTTGMIGLAAGQVFIGPLTDKYGRKHILVASMALFAIATVLCIFAPNIYIFNLMRIFQGVAGAGGIVISKSMATDMYSGKELADFMALLGSINGIAPVLAPVVGGIMAGVTTWQGVFLLLLSIGVILMVCSWHLPETLPTDKRINRNIIQVYANLFRVFRNSRFTLSTLAAMACFFTFFAYIASSPFILQQIYGLSPFQFSLCFALNALMIGVGAAVAPRFKRQTTSLKWGSINMVVAAALLAVSLFNHLPLIVIMAFYMYLLTSFGLMQPGLTAVALDAERNNAGAASAIFGASGFVAGAVASPIVAIGSIEITSSCVMFAGTAICIILTLPLCHRLK